MGQRRKSKASKEDDQTSSRLRLLRGHPLRLAFVGAVAAVLVALAGAGALLAGGGGGSEPATKTAAIVDQLSLTQPNPEFVSAARTTLAEAGYVTDYFPGEEVTVDLYRSLPERDYDIVILRVHSGIVNEVDYATGERTKTEYVSLFTGEPYDDSKYPAEQLNRLGKARYYEGAPPLFGIGPDFVRYSMEGKFDDTVVIMMGCDGLRAQKTAQAFLDKGASAFVSWSKPVSGPFTDATTERLLERLLIDGLSTAEAVSQTAEEMGPDPVYEGELRILEADG